MNSFNLLSSIDNPSAGVSQIYSILRSKLTLVNGDINKRFGACTFLKLITFIDTIVEN